RIVEVLAALLGAPSDRGRNAECGAGPLAYARWGDGLMVSFSDGAFAGWMVDGREAGAEHYTTMAGIGISSTRAEIDQVYVIDVEQTSLGTEFGAGDLYGLLSGPAPGDTVTNLWAGTTCIFR
ncbi:MAG TPA: hypothetical protein VFG50_06010, partial [Rhodothermales bacterium]|nr:hypothetical protein [Rhodothermales bacterium]